MRKIILIFLVSVSVLFGQEELVSCDVRFIDVNSHMYSYIDKTTWAYYYSMYNISNDTIEWVRIQTNQFLYHCEYWKGNRKMHAYVLWDKELETFSIIKVKIFCKTSYGTDVVVEATPCGNGDMVFVTQKIPEIRQARVDDRFGDITFIAELYFSGFSKYYFSINNLQRAYKIYQYNMDLPSKVNKTGIVTYEGSEYYTYKWVFATEDCNGNAFTAEDIAKINEGQQLVPLWASRLIFIIGLDQFDETWEFAQKMID